MKLNKKEKIIRSAFQTLAKIPDASFDLIAEQAEISRATLYRYFSSRQVLINEMCRTMDEKTFKKMRQIMNEETAPKNKLLNLLKYMIPQGDQVRFLFHEPFVSGDKTFNSLYEQVKKEWDKNMEQLQKDGLIRKDLPLRWAARTVDIQIFMAWDMIYNGEIAPNDAPELALKTILEGLNA